MMKKKVWPIFVLLLILTLGGCSISFKNGSKETEAIKDEAAAINNLETQIATNTEIITEKAQNIDEQDLLALSDDNLFTIISQESVTINTFLEFIAGAKVLAEKEIGLGAKLRTIDFDYDGSFFSYGAIFVGSNQEPLNDIPNNIAIAYNRDVKDSMALGNKIFEDFRSKNNKLIGISCLDTEKCQQLMETFLSINEIKVDDVKFSQEKLLNIVSKYTFSESPALEVTGEIIRKKDDLFGRFGKYKFDVMNGEIVGEIFNSNILGYIKFTDSDTDGLNDQEEKEFGTNQLLKDTDGDGHEDGTEVFGGYNPLGEGKINITSVSDAFEETDPN